MGNQAAVFCSGKTILITIKEIEKRILSTITPEAEAMGLEVVRIRMMGGKVPTLQIMIDKTDGGTDVEDCADFSRAISPLLDVHDFVDAKYPKTYILGIIYIL